MGVRQVPWVRRTLTTNTGSNNRGRDPLDRGLMAAVRDLAVAKLALTGALAVRTGDGPAVVESAGLDDTLSSTVTLETLPRAFAERARPRFLPLGLSVVGQGITLGNVRPGVILGQAAWVARGYAGFSGRSTTGCIGPDSRGSSPNLNLLHATIRPRHSSASIWPAR